MLRCAPIHSFPTQHRNLLGQSRMCLSSQLFKTASSSKSEKFMCQVVIRGTKKQNLAWSAAAATRATLPQNVHVCFLRLYFTYIFLKAAFRRNKCAVACVSHSVAVGHSFMTMLVFVGSGGKSGWGESGGIMSTRAVRNHSKILILWWFLKLLMCKSRVRFCLRCNLKNLYNPLVSTDHFNYVLHTLMKWNMGGILQTESIQYLRCISWGSDEFNAYINLCICKYPKKAK